jgi:catechol 2,3-dioxygenase-like lactoylglutathione lyase family enzyme
MPNDLRANLHHLRLASPAPERLARFYGEALDMTVERSGGAWTCSAPHRKLQFVEGPAKTLISAGYAAADERVLDRLRARLTAHGVRVDDAPADLFPRSAIGFRDPDGNALTFGLTDADSAPAGRMSARLQHLVVGSRDAAAMVAFYTGIVGLRESDRVDDDEGQLRTSFLRTDNEHHSFAVFQTAECRIDHHCYEVPDWNAIRDWGDRFAGLRTPIKWGPGRHGPGNNLFLFIHDPDGNWVELSAELMVVTDNKPVGRWRHEEHTLNSWGQAFLRT